MIHAQYRKPEVNFDCLGSYKKGGESAPSYFRCEIAALPAQRGRAFLRFSSRWTLRFFTTSRLNAVSPSRVNLYSTAIHAIHALAWFQNRK